MINVIKNVYEMFEDIESRDIFLNKLNYSVTGDFEYISNIFEKYVQGISNNFSWSNLIDNIKGFSKDRKIIIYGAGGEGDQLKSILNSKGIDVDCFCDRNINLKGSKDIPVISPDILFSEYNNGNKMAIIIGTEMFYNEIYNFLIENGVDSKDIFGGAVDVTKQYFDKKILNLHSEEFFVDCGALDLQSTINFLNICKNGTSYAFEPDEENFKKCVKLKQERNLENIEIYKYGCGSKEEKLKFLSTQNGSSYVDDNGNTEIEIAVLDKVLNEKKVSFIKMDIEGMELEALKGARNIIVKQKPKLAISIYHKPEDLIEIPMYIKSLVPEYKMYIRHYSVYPAETILYAVI